MENQEKQQELRKEFEEKTGQKWFTNPVCHGETGYASWDYQLSLEDEVIRLRETVKDMIGDITEQPIDTVFGEDSAVFLQYPGNEPGYTAWLKTTPGVIAEGETIPACIEELKKLAKILKEVKDGKA